MATTKKETVKKVAGAKAKAKETKKAAKQPVGKAKKAGTKKVTAKKAAQEKKEAPMLRLIKNDPYLADYSAAINGRHQAVFDKIKTLTDGGKQTLSDLQMDISISVSIRLIRIG